MLATVTSINYNLIPVSVKAILTYSQYTQHVQKKLTLAGLSELSVGFIHPPL